MNSVISVILLLGSLQGFLLAVFIFLRKKNFLANKFLSLSLAFLSLSLFANFIEVNHWHLNYPHLIGIQNMFIFVFIPALYFYVLFITQKISSLKKQHLFHLLPLAIYFIVNTPFIFQTAENKLLISDNSITLLSSVVQEAILNIYPIIYSTLMLIIISGYSKRIKEVYSNIEKIRLQWLKFLIYSLHIAILVSISVFVVSFSIADLPVFVNFLTAIIIVCLIYAIGYYSLQQPEIYNSEFGEIEKKLIQEKGSSKINVSTFNDYYSKLLKYMEEEKPYTNPELTIKDLSKELSIPIYILSKVIKEKSGLNYLSFINKHRIEDVKNELRKPSNKNEQIMILAYNAGFNSKSTFNDYFKKSTGTTPTQYREQQGKRI